MMTLVVLDCRHTERNGAGADPAIVQCREVFGEITASFTDLDRRGVAELESVRQQNSVRVQASLAPTASPASKGQLPPVAQTLQSEVVS